MNSLRGISDITVVGTYIDIETARIGIANTTVDVIVFDTGLAAGNYRVHFIELLNASPKSSILCLNHDNDYHAGYQAMVAGALGCIGSNFTPNSFRSAVRQIHAGGSPIQSEVSRLIVLALQASVKTSPLVNKLSRREFELMNYIMAGYSYAAAAKHVGISLETVRTHVRNAYRKLGIVNRAEAASSLSSEFFTISPIQKKR